MQELINWLQLSDFHCGQNDNDWMQRIRSEFCSQFTKIINDRGLPYPDLIFITGDLAYSGKSNEYDIFDKTMKDIKACLPGWNPTILSVPGNHDSDRDKLVLNKSNIDSFTNYLSNWCKRNCVCFKDCKERLNNICVANCRKRQFNIACSSYPGDYYWQFNLPGQFPFAIVGLNSELTENIGTSPNITFKRLEMLQKATHEKGLHPKNLDRKFLLMHHPPSNFRHQQQIFKDIDTLFGNIDICLHGHLHTSQSTIIRTVSGKTEYQYQGVSLCGLEHFGTLAENRSFGFSIGSISRYGEIRVWPFAREYVEGAYNFVWDRRLGEERHSDRTEGTLSGILIRKATRPKFDFYQLAKESNKITFIGLFHRSSGPRRQSNQLFK
jgi:calcineurin-like phosphoesterase family protein